MINYLHSTGVRCLKDNICVRRNHPSFHTVWFYLPLHTSLINSENITIAMILKCYPLSCRHNLHVMRPQSQFQKNINQTTNKKTKYCLLIHHNSQLHINGQILPNHFDFKFQHLSAYTDKLATGPKHFCSNIIRISFLERLDMIFHLVFTIHILKEQAFVL